MAELNSSPEKTGGKPARKKLNPRIDLTAMVDLAFLLITFFMLTTSLQKPKIFNVIMPDKSDDRIILPESRTLTICIGKNNEALSYLGLPDKPLTDPRISNCASKEIREAILDIEKRVEATTGKSLLVIIKPSDHSVYADMVNVLDELNIAGDPTYAITDIQPKDIAMLKEHKAY
jgi:biopolymer transport protein ExbD